MARTKFILWPAFGLTLALAACAPSPLYVAPRGGTVGEVPRDGRGEPIWSAIRPVPPAPPYPAMPAAGGIPITPPAGYRPQ